MATPVASQQQSRGPASSRPRARRRTDALAASPMSPSRYNFAVTADGAALLYNVNSGALLRLEGEDGKVLADWLASRRKSGTTSLSAICLSCGASA